MASTRRVVLKAGMLASASTLLGAAGGGRGPRFAAMAFDALAVFDTRPIVAHAERLFPGRGAELTSLWRSRQFEYTWLRTMSGHYRDFMQVTEDALVFATRALGLALPDDDRAELLQPYLRLGAWPDAAPALRAFKVAGVRLVLLSNFTSPMLNGSIAASGLDGVFERALSTDLAETYKPDPRAYALGLDALALPREQILFVAFAGWDAAGATAFGYPTYWLNRSGAPQEELGAAPDGVGADFDDLAAFAAFGTPRVGGR